MTTKFSQLNNVGVGIAGDQLITLRTGLDVLTNYVVPVPLAGGTMTGYLILNADPTNPLGAATKEYVDAEISGSVTSVTGTSNRITASPTTGDVVVDISASYVGQASITTLGTIGTGTWAGTTIAVAHGGTGLSTATTAYSLVCSGTTATGNFQVLSSIGTSGQVLTSQGASSLPHWTTVVSGVSSVSGTSNQIDVSPTTGDCVVSIDAAYVGQTSITTLGTIATGVWNGTVVTGTYGGTGVNNGASTITIGGNVTFSGAHTFTGTLSANTSVTFPTSGTLVNTAVTTLSSLVSVGALSTGSLAAGFTPVTVPIGGTGLSSTTAYAVVCGGTTTTGALQQVSGLGTATYVLTSNGAAALPTWQAASGSGIVTLDGDSGSATGSTVTISGGTTGLTTSASSATVNLTGTLIVANGGTGIATTTAYAVICGGTTATGALQHVSGVGTSGYVLTSNGAGALPSWQAGGGGGGGISWNDQTSGTVTMAVNNGYVIDNGASLVTLTLPATAALGSTFIVAGKSAGGWTIAEASGQTIHVGSTAATATTGTVSSSNQYDCITLVCVTANTTFVAYGIQGNLVVV